MRPEIDLHLIRQSLIRLGETTYFNGKLHEFNESLIQAISYVLENQATLAPQIVSLFTSYMRHAHTYFDGSTIRDAPYEIEFCLKTLPHHWTKKGSLITTALTADQNFHFSNADPWTFINASLPSFPGARPNESLVLLGVPKLYVHKPLFCIPLYHEVGHFVDLALGVTKMSEILVPLSAAWERAHRQEHFADLFAASYVGLSSTGVLSKIAPNNPSSATHPATAVRITLVDKFLAGTPDSLITLYNQCLQQLGAPILAKHFTTPSLSPAFDDIRPYDICSELELHGIFEAGWNYLEDAIDRQLPPWSKNMKPYEIERIVNDLVEKSIRNYSIAQRWRK